ncbi:CBS domain-containing protein [Nocardia cyriacigeorgica]|uniref:CBS domain-containing protein n=1 Tax=Nocardia cyriacigeorgica TaxID=135487 RepID=A0A5R8PIX4_9NOCA|nr:CBS domain-containing protein [Nocardia cyriacigeorgica]TLF77524.1 CBS domain-containing protein [Nocardia cyriacigeorgica]TLG15547.1 CBS domain-containing protein [Nocardia cyriacigeorgica]
MRIAEILRRKGSEVATVRPDSTVRALLATLAAHNIGAVVVSSDGVGITGIVSERDVVRSLHQHGAELLDAPVSQIMTTDVRTCDPDDLVDGLRRTMTDHRIRHLPVVRDGRLIGIVSIGDVVKSAISELATEREQLVGYVQGTY